MSGAGPVDVTEESESEPVSGAGGPKGTGPISCCASEPGSGAPPRRRRRVVALSAADRERVARGELPEAAEEEARRRRVDALTDARSRSGGDAHANDARLLRDVPPHW